MREVADRIAACGVPWRRDATILALVAVHCLVSTASGGVLYVDDDAPPGGDGRSWQTAHPFLQDALGDLEGVREVRVAGGLYRPDRTAADPGGTRDRSATFQLVDGVTLLGGYAGLGAHHPDERDVQRFRTVLTGDLAANDGPDFAGNEENSYHVVTADDAVVTAILDGFTITAGNAECDCGQLDPRQFGGGLHITGGAIRVVDCAVVANAGKNGGGLYCAGGDLTLVGCTFAGNQVQHPVGQSRGGGVSMIDTDATLIDCLLTENSATTFGGGLYQEGGELSLTNCRFENNSVDAGSFEYGGAISGAEGHLTLTGCAFNSNSAGEDGGAVFYRDGSVALLDCRFDDNVADDEGGAVAVAHNVRLVVTDCTFINNRATDLGDGGAINLQGAAATLTGCVFRGNRSLGVGSAGGAIAAWLADPVLVNCTFEGNSSDGVGGALYGRSGRTTLINCAFVDNSARQRAGAVHISNGDPVMLDCSFERNSVTAGSGGALQLGEADATMRGCTFRDNRANVDGGAIYVLARSAPRIVSCSFAGNSAANRGGAMYLAPGHHGSRASSTLIVNCFFGANVATEGGALANSLDARPQVANCTFSANAAEQGGGAVFNDSNSMTTLIGCTLSNNAASQRGGAMFSREQASATLLNCILWENGVEPVLDSDDATTSVEYCDVEGGWNGAGGQNIDADPMFVDADGPDGIGGTVDDDLRLLGASPAVDAGHNWALPGDVADVDGDGATGEILPLDQGGAPRVTVGAAARGPGCGAPAIVDMGAFEFPGPEHQPIRGDVDGDGRVGFDDVLVLLRAWGPTDGCVLADLDRDGIVGAADLLALLAVFSC